MVNESSLVAYIDMAKIYFKMPCDHETFILGTLDHQETFCFVDFGSNDYFSY